MITKKNKFNKEQFKKSVVDNIKALYRKTLDEADPQQIFQAVSYAVKDQIVENWMETQRPMRKKIPKWFTICPWSFSWDGLSVII